VAQTQGAVQFNESLADVLPDLAGKKEQQKPRFTPSQNFWRLIQTTMVVGYIISFSLLTIYHVVN
jgi:hypothetical protein